MQYLYDEQTLTSYTRDAKSVAKTPVPDRCKTYLRSFIEKLPLGASVLDLGCGAGWASSVLARNGFDIYALDAVPELVDIASSKLSRRASHLRFDEIEAPETFDAIFACDALHYVPRTALPTILGLLSASLKPGGLLFASLKQGQGEYRDSAGRFYACYQPDEISGFLNGSSGLLFSSLKTDASVDMEGQHRIFLGLHCRRGMQVWR